MSLRLRLENEEYIRQMEEKAKADATGDVAAPKTTRKKATKSKSDRSKARR